MSVLHLWMLWLLPLAALPIVLHLLTLHRLRTVELPTFRFLFDSYIQQRRRMQFLEALLAMLRTLFLLFLIFMVCRPVVKHWDQLFGGTATGSGGREVILLVDCSASMNARGGGTSALERAKAAAVSVVDRLRSADQVTLVRVTARPEEVLSRFNTDTQGIKDRIEALEPSASRANLFAALLQLFGPEASRRTNPVVYLFTDGQASTWKEARAQGLERLIPAGTPFTLVNVGASRLGTDAAGGDTRPVALENRAIVGDAPRRNRAIVGLPFVLTPRIVNHGRTEAELTLSVLIDEKEVARTQVTVKPGEAMTRAVVYTPSQPGLQQGRFEISGKTPDVFPDDDRFLFTLNVQPKVRVLVVNGHPSDDPLTDEAHYLVTALTSQAAPAEADGKKAAGPTSREIQRSLDVVDLPQPGLTVDALRDASIVILANCGALNDQQWGWLRAFVADGGGLLVFPGDKVSAAGYTAQLAKTPGRGGSTLTAATLLDPVGDVEKADTYTALEFDPGHPALSVFNPKESFRTVRVYRRFRLALPAKRGNGWPVARFEAERTPAVVESRHGDGVVLVAAFPVHPRWGNLPLKPDFVPLMLRLVVHAEHRPEAEVAPVVVGDSAAEVVVSAAWNPAETTVKDPDGRVTAVPMERAGARLLGTFDRTARRGYYTVDVRSGRTDQLKAAALAFAVNLSPEEAEFALLREADVRKLMPSGVELTFVDASAEAQDLHGAIGKERELWPILIWLAFAVIGVEFLLATLAGHRRPDEDGPGVTERVLSVGTGAWVGRMTGAGEK